MKFGNKLLIMLIAFFLGGCTQVGPSYLPKNRQAYNTAMQVSGNEQLLLNIVRLRYNDTPYFIDISGITSSVEFEASAAPRLSLVNTLTSSGTGTKSRTTGFDPRMVYKERPIFSYRPLEGKTFSKLLLQPIGINAVMQLHRAGYGPGRIINIIINELAYIQNLSGANDSVIDDKQLEKFIAFLGKAQYLLEHDVILIKPALYKGRELLGLYFIGNKKDKADYLDMLHMLGVNGFQKVYYFIPSYEPKVDEKTYGISTRTLLSVLNYLSMGVDVPRNDIESGVVNKADSAMQQELIRTFFRVKVSANRPNNTYLSIFYKGYWFYIADTDIESRKTIALVRTLFEMLDDTSYQTQPIFVSS